MKHLTKRANYYFYRSCPAMLSGQWVTEDFDTELFHVKAIIGKICTAEKLKLNQMRMSAWCNPVISYMELWSVA